MVLVTIKPLALASCFACLTLSASRPSINLACFFDKPILAMVSDFVAAREPGFKSVLCPCCVGIAFIKSAIFNSESSKTSAQSCVQDSISKYFSLDIWADCKYVFIILRQACSFSIKEPHSDISDGNVGKWSFNTTGNNSWSIFILFVHNLC